MMDKVQRAIADFDMLQKGEEVLVALSGGADSVALLLILNELGYITNCCHINHQLRGEESDSDEVFCVELCKKIETKLFVEKLDIYTFCKKNKLGIEEGARLLRYNAFEKYCYGKKIATAHTNSDNLETVLINLTRGTALTGLCGIPPVRGNIIRPLIYCTRDDIENYLKCKNQEYVTDSTNLSCDFTRNKIRHEVIPRLVEINPGLHRTFLKTVNSISRDNLFLDSTANSVLEGIKISENTYNTDILKTTDISIALRCIAQIFKNHNIKYNNSRINEVYNIIQNEGKINLSGDVYAIAKMGKLKISCLKSKEKIHFCEEVNFEKEYNFNNKLIKLIIENIN